MSVSRNVTTPVGRLVKRWSSAARAAAQPTGAASAGSCASTASFELDERGAGLDAELGRARRRLAYRGERLRLLAAAVARDDQLLPERLVQRIAGDELSSDEERVAMVPASSSAPCPELCASTYIRVHWRARSSAHARPANSSSGGPRQNARAVGRGARRAWSSRRCGGDRRLERVASRASGQTRACIRRLGGRCPARVDSPPKSLRSCDTYVWIVAGEPPPSTSGSSGRRRCGRAAAGLPACRREIGEESPALAPRSRLAARTAPPSGPSTQNRKSDLAVPGTTAPETAYDRIKRPSNGSKTERTIWSITEPEVEGMCSPPPGVPRGGPAPDLWLFAAVLAASSH